MADGKQSASVSGNIGAGAGILAKRFQKSMNRAQEKVLQKLGKTMETKDEQFEECCANLNKQQADGLRLCKDVKTYYNAVKVMHESSKRLSQTLKDIYEPDWDGVEDLTGIMQSEDLLWNDYEEKLNDQVVRSMENYTRQFQDVKERVAKRGRKLVDYDSTRHHLESLQNSKKRDDAKLAKAEEEFNKAQEVFEDINKELREELPVLYQSRISCYVTMFQNISNLRDVFYKEMSVLNHDIYNMMKKIETQHSTKPFIIKGLNSVTNTKSKKRKSVTISAPIPCNTAFPPDHPAMSKLSMPNTLMDTPSDTPPQRTGSATSEISDSDSNSFDSEPNTPKRQSSCSEGSEGLKSEGATEDASETGTDESAHTNGQKQANPDSVSTEQVEGDESETVSSEDKHIVENTPNQPSSTEEQDNAPVPAPRRSSSISKKPEGQDKTGSSESESAKEVVKDQKTEYENPPAFLYKAVALESQDSDEGVLLLFEKGDVILVYTDEEEKPEDSVWGIREKDWIQYKDLTLLSGIVKETMIQRIPSE